MSPAVCCGWLLGVLSGMVGVADMGPPDGDVRADSVIAPTVRVALEAQGGVRVRVWVFLTDKAIESSDAFETAITRLADSYHPRAKARRALRRTAPGLFDGRDLPVARTYADQIAATGATLRTQSKWLNAVSALATLEQIEAIAKLPFVRRIQPLGRSHRIEPDTEPAPLPEGGPLTGDPAFYGRSWAQLDQINVPAVHDLGFTGEGVIIGILDTGFHRTHEAFNEPGHEVDVLGEHDFINDDGNTDQEEGDPAGQNSHGSLILGTIAAYKPEQLIGGAYDASFYLAKTEDISDEQPIEEDYYVSGLEWIEANGGDVATSSLSYSAWYTQEDFDGLTATTTIAVNIATANGVACCTAASNSGHDQDPTTSHLGAPADAFEVLTVGAVNVEGEIAGFSSDGPTADGRTKPEVLAQGVSTSTIDPRNDRGYRTASGTSLSTPLVAAATALVIQAHPDWSVRQIRSAFMQNASWYIENGEFDPLFVHGYGIIDTLAAVEMDFTGDIDRDGDTDLDDLEQLFDCLTGPGESPSEECTDADIDADGDVDVKDFTDYQQHYTGPWDG